MRGWLGTSPVPRLIRTNPVAPASPLIPIGRSGVLTLTHSRDALMPLEYGDLAVLGLAVWFPAGLFLWMLKLIDA